MQHRTINGKKIAEVIEQRLLKKTILMKKQPVLHILQIGNHSISNKFVELKQRKGEALQIAVKVIKIPKDKANPTLLGNLISQIMTDSNGIMFQLPIETEFPVKNFLSLIPLELDVDGLLLNQSSYPTAVASAVIEVVSSQKIDVHSKILIIGDSPYVGKSIFSELKKNHYSNIEIINEFTSHKVISIKSADVLISCVGKPAVFSERHVKNGSILIDVGTSLNSAGKIVGDFQLTPESPRFSAYTPVPGGVGPITIACLLRNVVEQAESKML